MQDFQDSRRARAGQPAAVFAAHAAALTAVAAALYALRGAPWPGFAGVALACLAWALVAALEARAQPVLPAPVKADDTAWRKLALAALLSLPFVAVWDAAYRPASLAAGAALLAVGGGLRVWSLAALGARFTWTAGVVAGHTVVRAGPYRWMKHPNYAGNVLFAAGMAAASGGRVAWVPVGVLTAAVVAAARHEEAFLKRNLPGY